MIGGARQVGWGQKYFPPLWRAELGSIHLENVDGSDRSAAYVHYPERPAETRFTHVFLDLPAFGLFCVHTKGAECCCELVARPASESLFHGATGFEVNAFIWAITTYIYKWKPRRNRPGDDWSVN